jgi:mannose-6-phosphate isomerase
MTPQPKVVRVSGFLKNYHWGKENGLSEFLAVNGEQPQAELWFGNHPAGPSLDLSTNQTVNTNQPAPILVKILAIDQPLSIQVHPDQKFAKSNFEKLSLSDPNQKDEILIALEPVWAFAGVKPRAQRIKILKELEIYPVGDKLVDDFQAVFSLSQAEVNQKIENFLAIISKNNDEVIKEVFARLKKFYPGDPGILIAGLLEFHNLLPGEAVYVPAGCPHEYISGKAIEVMTNSDNVFRMGLTIKPIEIEHSLSVLKEVSVTKFAAAEKYSPSSNFEVFDLVDTKKVLPAKQYRVVLAISGLSQAEVESETYSLSPGEALLVTDHTKIDLSVNGRAIVAELVKDGRL